MKPLPPLRYPHVWVSFLCPRDLRMPRLHLPPLAHTTCFKEQFLSAIELVLPDMSSQSGLVTAAERASRKRLPGTWQCSLGRGRSPFFSIRISPSCRCSYRYFIMQSCWAFDSRKRPSFPNLTSFLGCQLADAEEVVCGVTR